jgi:uncharacterized protein
MRKDSTKKLPAVYLGKSTIHGQGLFAGEEIKEGRRIIEYKGERIPSGEGTVRSTEHEVLTYIFTLNDKYDVDGAVNGNEARFANHSCDGNAYVDIVRDKIWLIAERDIGKDEEITYDYSLDAEDLMPCRCGARRCRGYMNDADDKRVKQALKKKREKARKAKSATYAKTREAFRTGKSSKHNRKGA